MTGLPAIHGLPVEVLRRAFACLGAGFMSRLAHVCGRWRAIAFNHPDYWGSIIISNVEPATISRAYHKLTQAKGRPLSRFEINYAQKHVRDDPVLHDLLPMLRKAVPHVRVLFIKVESMYRLHVEDALCQAAPWLRRIIVHYVSEPLPDLHYNMPLGYKRTLFSGQTGYLRCVQLYHVLLPSVVIQAFERVDEVYWIHALSVKQDDFPCYLFHHFPNMTRLRMTGGTCLFTNAPLPADVYKKFSRLAWVDLEFLASQLPPFFRHLPLHDLDDLTICAPDEDGVYLTLEPLQSWFDLILSPTGTKEFLITVKSRQTHKIRRFAEPLRYYYEGSPHANALLENDGFFEQLASFHIHLSLWSRLRPWLLPSMDALPKLILELDEDTPHTVWFPPEPLSCAGLTTLVIQAKYDYAYVDTEDLIAFADRLSKQRIALELRRVLIEGSQELLDARFTSIEYSLDRYLGHKTPTPTASKPEETQRLLGCPSVKNSFVKK